MYMYLPEGCKFGFLRIILRSPFVDAHISIVRRHLDDILADYESHLVPEKYQSMSATSQWHYAESYMTWFYHVPHPVITLDAPRLPPRPAHEEILKNEQARDDHIVDVLSICQNIMWITYESIESGLFDRGGNDAITLARFILIDT